MFSPPIQIRSGVSVKDVEGMRRLEEELQTSKPASEGAPLDTTSKAPSKVVDMLLTKAEVAAEPVTQLAKKIR